ncbi:MAG: DUF4062 domain-containing protein [Chlorobium sp.]|nr:MAG: DUF4062 domain-containing protein [Chlorobium sp.]
MDKRYQVFLSSTYANLKDERQKVIQTLLEMLCKLLKVEKFYLIKIRQHDFSVL